MGNFDAPRRPTQGIRERGEIRAGQISDRVARVPVDLFRYELMMTLKPVADEVIEEIVDTVFMPLVRLGAAETS